MGESVVQLAEEENGPITRPVTLAYDNFLIQHNSPLSDGADQLLYPYPVALYMAGHDIIIRGNKLQELGTPPEGSRSVGQPAHAKEQPCCPNLQPPPTDIASTLSP